MRFSARRKSSGRPTDELIPLYALECVLDRLAHSRYADRFVLKGGVLLAALGVRRPTRDIDFSASAVSNDADDVLGIAREIAGILFDDGLVFDTASAIAQTIRDEDEYSGAHITLTATLSRANVRLHVDVNVGDPVWPTPQQIELPRLLEGTLNVRGYPLEMVLAEKIVTALSRGTANTRWRDFLDVYALTGQRRIESMIAHESLLRVARHRGVPLASLRTELAVIPTSRRHDGRHGSPSSVSKPSRRRSSPGCSIM